MVDFNKVILADGEREGLIGQASIEGLLAKGYDENLENHYRQSQYKQESLSLLVLFEKILVATRHTSLHIPNLEDNNIIEFIPYELGSFAPAQRLEKTVQTRPFVLNKLMLSNETKDLFWIYLSELVGIPRRVLYNAAIDYFLATYRNDERGMQENLLSKVLPPLSEEFPEAFPNDLLKEMQKDLLSSVSPSEDRISHAKALYLEAIVAAHDVEAYQNLSEKYNAGVATQELTGASPEWTFISDAGQEISNSTNTFYLLRCALHEEGLYFPRIDSIEHALKLRKDPNLMAFREQLALFQSYLTRGDKEAAMMLRKEVSKAKLRLKQTSQWDKTLRLVTYFSLPANLVESLVVGVPIIGTTLSVFSAAATMAVEKVKRKNQWVLFGS
jgi:hypothetical protein